jgi:hypothetical protein
MPASYRMLIDWHGNGFEGSAADVTGRVLDQRTAVTVRYGRDQARQLSPTSPGELNFELNNTPGTTRRRTPHPRSPASSHPGGPCSCWQPQHGAETAIYTGFLDDFSLRPELDQRSVPVSCIDALGRLRGVSVSTSLYQGIRTGEAIGYLLDAVGWPASARDLDAGASVLPFWWLDDSDAFDALMQLADSEGPSALVTVDQPAQIVFRDRHHRLTRAASLTAQATWRSSGLEPVISAPVQYEHGWKEIVNSVSVEVPQYARSRPTSP